MNRGCVQRLASSDVYDPVPQGRRAVRFASVRVVARNVYSRRREAPKGRGPPKGGRIPVAGAEREARMDHMNSLDVEWVADRLGSEEDVLVGRDGLRSWRKDQKCFWSRRLMEMVA